MTGIPEKTGRHPWLLACLLAALATAVAYAQPEDILLDYGSQLAKRQQPPVRFDHGLHLELIDCLECHHRYDDGVNMLDEAELEEGADAAQCTSCHEFSASCDLADIFHGQCLECHNQLQKIGEASGPVLCNRCHRRP